MLWCWFFLLLFGLLLGFILFVNSTVELTLQRNGDEKDYIAVAVVISHLIKIKKEFPMLEIVHHGHKFGVHWKDVTRILSTGVSDQEHEVSFSAIKRAMDHMQNFIKQMHNVRGKLKDTLRGFHLVQFRWNTVIGIDDAAIAAPFTGFVWAIKGILLQHLFSLLALEASPDISVIPDYKRNYYQTKLHCIFQFKVGYAIYAGLRLLYLYKKGVRHGRTSNSEFNDCCNG